jgi:hypothetical protein
MSVRKTAAKFEVNASTVQRVARPFDDAEHVREHSCRVHRHTNRIREVLLV